MSQLIWRWMDRRSKFKVGLPNALDTSKVFRAVTLLHIRTSILNEIFSDCFFQKKCETFRHWEYPHSSAQPLRQDSLPCIGNNFGGLCSKWLCTSDSRFNLPNAVRSFHYSSRGPGIIRKCLLKSACLMPMKLVAYIWEQIPSSTFMHVTCLYLQCIRYCCTGN